MGLSERKINRIPRSQKQASKQDVRQHDTTSLLGAFNHANHLDISLRGLKGIKGARCIVTWQGILSYA